MGKKKLQRVVRSGYLTPEEIARDAKIRRQVQQEFPPARPLSPAAPDSISETLKRAIERSDRSLHQIAREAGVSESMLVEFLSGQRDIRMATADRLANVLGLRLSVG